ncbi:hypothetical protein, partial [Alcaligenes faecalis]|uniref:hypothetical protein n=1 Tax=Alcaligenes faecalis TaxID=511 RepID=UPI001E512C64
LLNQDKKATQSGGFFVFCGLVSTKLSVNVRLRATVQMPNLSCLSSLACAFLVRAENILTMAAIGQEQTSGQPT